MAEKISVEIGLEGGDEVTRQLEQIGQAGQKTFSDIQGAAEQVDLSSISDGFQDVGNTGQEAFDKIKTAVQNAAVFEQVVQGVKKVEGAFEALGTAATRMATRMTKSLGVFGVLARSFGPVGIAAGVLGGLLVKAERDVSSSINGMVASAAKLGVTVQEFDRLRQALARTGIAADVIAPGLQTLKEQLAEGVGTGLQAQIAQLEKMPDGINRTALAFERLGEGLGAQVIAGLQTGTITAEGFAASLANITPLTQQQIVDAAKYSQALNGLTNAWTELKAGLAGTVTVPMLAWLTSQLPGIQAGIATTAREFQALGSVINSVATVGAGVIEALAAPIKLVIDEVVRLASTFSGWNWDPIAAGVQVWNDITGAIQRAIDKVMEFIGLKPTGGTPAAGGAPGMAGGGLLGGRGTGTSDSNLAWLSRGEYITPAHVVRQPGVLSFLEALRRGGNIPGFAAGGTVGGFGFDFRTFAGVFDRVIGLLGSAYDAIATTMRTFGQAFISLDQSMVSIQNTIMQAANALQELNQGVKGKASGGLLGGRGTGTSDSNLAWVSRGEYITPARAVRQPGVLAFLEALRLSGGDLSRVLNGMGRFALGGLVPRAIPAYAGGGLSGGNHVTIQFPGLPAIGGLRASSGVVDELRKAAALAQVRSGGRKPSRYS